MSDFATGLKELRKKRGLTQEQLAERLSVSFQTISKWENGITNPDFSLIAPLAEALQVSTDVLLGAERREQKKAFEDEYRRIPQRQWQERVAVLDRALNEFPRDYRFCRLKGSAYFYACRMDPEIKENSGKMMSLLAECEMLFKHCLEDPNAEEHGRIANLDDLVAVLVMRSKREEAVAIAMNEKGESRDRLLRGCLEGDALKKHNQKMVDEKWRALFEALKLCYTLEAIDLTRGLIEAFYPEKSTGYYEWQENIEVTEYRLHLREGRFDEAEKAYGRLCVATDRKMEVFYAKEEPFSTELWYTHPAMDMLTDAPDAFKCFNPYMMTASMGTQFPPFLDKAFAEREGMKRLAQDMEEKRRKWEEQYGEYEPR